VIAASLVLSIACAVLAQIPNPIIVPSEVEPGGEFTVTLTFQRTNGVCFDVPAGHYHRVWTFVATADDQDTGRGILTLYRSNPNAAAPTTRGLQIAQRFELIRPTTGGDMWRSSETSFDGPTTLCAVAGSVPAGLGMFWMAKLEGKV
jgi:hypothetical protein